MRAHRAVTLFLTWAVDTFDVRWLSTHCQDGSAEHACHALRYALPARTLPVEWQFIEAIPAVRWDGRKIDAIEVASDFYWLDDQHGKEAMAILAEHGKADRAIEVDVNRDPDDLLRALRVLAQALGLWRWE